MRRIFRRFFLPLSLILLTYVIWSLWDIARVGNVDRNRTADCAIVFGAAAWHNKPSPVFKERLNHAIELYRDQRVSALILTGGYGEGAPFSESEVAYDYCLKKGVPRHAIRIETDSQTTLENVVKAKEILQAEGWKTALLVSDPWHLKRCRKMAQNLGLTVFTSATKSTRYRSFGVRSKFLLREFIMYHGYLFSGN
ncbi:MAG: YdcF family protein [Akkermansiaceae bacterium]